MEEMVEMEQVIILLVHLLQQEEVEVEHRVVLRVHLIADHLRVWPDGSKYKLYTFKRINRSKSK